MILHNYGLRRISNFKMAAIVVRPWLIVNVQNNDYFKIFCISKTKFNKINK